jgi:selenide,water dikinase
VDDPFQFGQVAAANALSDIYAMGARPLFALNIVGFPTNDLPYEVLSEILRGGADKTTEAGIPIVGGHSIDDREPKYGLVVTGLLGSEGALANSTARAGDRIVLTKPLGSGILSTAIKRGLLDEEATQRVVGVMIHLNAGAARAARAGGVTAATDVTGFGLLGHLREMTAGAALAARISASAVPVLPGVAELAAQGVVPGGTERNMKAIEPFVEFDSAIPAAVRIVLADAQTSGGLLLAVPPERLPGLLSALRENLTPAAAVIGEFLEGPPGTIQVAP